MPSAARLFRCFLILSVAAGSAAFAQDEGDSPATAEEANLDSWDRLIYVPFQELQKVFDNQDSSAVIPYAEYLELMKAYLNREADDSSSPDAVITKSQFAGTVEKDVVRITAEFSINVLKEDGWARLPLAFGSAAVGKVTTDDDSKVILRGVDTGRYELLLNGAGEHSVTLELLATVKTSPESRSFALNCPVVGISELTLTVPEADQSIEVSPLQVLLPVDGSNEQQTVVKASLGATGNFEVRWNPKAGLKPVMDLLTSVSNETNVRVEAGLVQSTTAFNYEVLRGELTEVTVLVPADARIIDVVSSNGRIGNWKPEAVGETHQKIRVELLTPATDRFQLTVQTERTPEGNALQLVGKSDDGKLQGVHAKGVVRESGQLKLTSDPSLTTLVKTQTGVKRIDAGAGAKAKIPVQAWEFSGTTGSLIVEYKPVEPRLLVNQAARVVFDDDELKLTTRLTYTVERAGVFQLNVSYPESLTIDTVRADGMSEFNVDKEAGKLTLSLTQKRMGQINVDITAHQPFDAAAENLESEIPSITPLNVEREDGRIELFAPRFLDVSTVDENTTGVFAAEPSSTPAIGRAVRTASWKYTQRPFKLAVKTSPRPAQLAASIATEVNIDPKQIVVDSVLRFNIRNAGIDTFRVAVPEALASEVSFKSRNPQYRIQQSNKSDQADDNGWIVWTLVLQDEVTGTVEIDAHWVTSLDDLEDEATEQSVQLDPIRILPPYTDEQADKRKVTISETRGEVRLLRHESLSISAQSEDASMEKIDVRELQLMPADGYLAFRYFAQPAKATVKIRKHEIHDVVATVVSRAAVEVVTDKQDLATIRARFRVKTSERQRLRIDLPARADLQSPLLNDSRTDLEKATDVEVDEGWEAYYVNISRSENSDEEFLLTIQLTCPITEPNTFPYDRQGGKQILRLPALGERGGSTVVQESRVAVWGPKDIAFVGEPTHWSIAGRQVWSVFNPLVCPTAAAEATRLNEWIGSSGSATDFARQGNVTVYRALGRKPQINIVWWSRPFLVAVISGALLFIGFILRRTTWENRLTLTIIACLIFALWSLKDSSEALQFLSAGSLALIAVAGIWLTGLFLGNSQQREAVDGGQSSDSPPPQPTETPAAEPAASAQAAPPKGMTSGHPDDPPMPPGTISPSPETVQWMNDIMGGKA